MPKTWEEPEDWHRKNILGSLLVYRSHVVEQQLIVEEFEAVTGVSRFGIKDGMERLADGRELTIQDAEGFYKRYILRVE